MFFAVFGPFLTSLLIAVISIPVIIRVADLKHLTDEPDNDRKLHKGKIPTLGGIAIFAGTLFSFSAFTDYLQLSDIKFMIPSLILLFFAGIKDDILALSPDKKLAIQIMCATLITILGNLYLTSLWGIFGITDLSWSVGVTLTIVTIVGFINAFNLVDGINGLAAGLGLIAAVFFGTWFYLTHAFFLSVLSFALAGSLFGFLYYNLLPARIFMGDTGSMIIGFIISLLAIKFIEINRSGLIEAPYFIKAAPGVAIAAVIIPIADLTRVFFVRIWRRRSPFHPDRSHIHHILLDTGLSHVQSSMVLYTATAVAIGTSLLLKERRSFEVVLVMMLLYFLGTCLAVSMRNKKRLRYRSELKV